MKILTYTVRDISLICDVCEETVRRWARTGKIKNICPSNKLGIIVAKEDLEDFMNNNPKYRRKI